MFPSVPKAPLTQHAPLFSRFCSSKGRRCRIPLEKYKSPLGASVRSVLWMTHRLFPQRRHANVWAGGRVCTLGRRSQVTEPARRSSWERSGRRGKFQPFIGRDVCPLQSSVEAAPAASHRRVFPDSAHFPEGVGPGCPRSGDKGRSFHNAPTENKIKAEGALFSEGRPHYN